MNESEVDQMLRDYADRWRAAQPALPPVNQAMVTAMVAAATVESTPVRRTGTRRWFPLVAVAAAVAVVVAVVAVVAGLSGWRHQGTRPPVATTPTSSSVSWLPLPASGVAIPATTVPGSPDPAAAGGLPPCRAGDLHASDQVQAAAGTRYLVVTLTSDVRCRLSGVPSLSPLGPNGAAVAVPVQPDASYDHPVAVGGADSAILRMGWASGWCATPVTVANVRITLPESGGTVTVTGFGASACYGTPGSGATSPITVGSFTPPDSAPERHVTVFDGVRAEVVVPDSVAAGQRLHFQVVLTAAAGRDVPLGPCPDYTISLGATSASYALNCAGVGYRDASGHPYLPAGVPVRFDMEAAAPTAPDGAVKLLWALVLDEPVSAGAVIAVS